MRLRVFKTFLFVFCGMQVLCYQRMAAEYYAWGTEGFHDAKAVLGANVSEKHAQHTDLLDGIGVKCADGKPVWGWLVITGLARG